MIGFELNGVRYITDDETIKVLADLVPEAVDVAISAYLQTGRITKVERMPPLPLHRPRL